MVNPVPSWSWGGGAIGSGAMVVLFFQMKWFYGSQRRGVKGGGIMPEDMVHWVWGGGVSGSGRVVLGVLLGPGEEVLWVVFLVQVGWGYGWCSWSRLVGVTGGVLGSGWGGFGWCSGSRGCGLRRYCS